MVGTTLQRTDRRLRLPPVPTAGTMSSDVVAGRRIEVGQAGEPGASFRQTAVIELHESTVTKTQLQSIS